MSGENLNSAATLSLEIDTGDAAGRLDGLITKYEALQAAFAKEAKAGGVINLSEQVKRLHEELEQTKRALATSLKDFEVLQAKSANGAVAMDKLSASLNRVKGAAEVSGGSIEAATKNVKTLAEEVDRMSKTGVRFDSMAKNFKMLTLESDASEKGVRKFLATLEQVQYELQQSSGAKQHVIEKWGNDAIAALPKIEALRVKVAEFDAAAAKKTEDGRVAKLVQQLKAEEEAERASYDRRLKVALGASAARRAAEESYVGSWAGLLAERDAAEAKALANSVRRLAEQEAAEAASNKKRLADAMGASAARRAAEKSYVGSWAGLLAERDAAEAKALANSVRRLTEQEAAEAASSKKRLADATSTIASRRAAEESYTKWWIGELASRQAAEAAATLRNVTQRSNMQRLNAERLDRSLGLGGAVNPQSAFYESLGAVKGGGSTLASLESSTASDFAAAEAAKRLAAETGNLTEKKAKLTPVINSAHEAQKKWNATSSETHALARGLSGSLGQLWMTYGQIAPLLAGAALGSGFKSAMQKGAEFEYQLTFVKAIGGESADAVRDLSKAALDLGSSSMKGPVELAGGLRILAQAGLTAQEAIMALSSATDLAIVGEMGMEDASVTLVGVMNAFSLSVSDISRIGDVFAKAAALSQTSVSGMTNAMRTASVVGEQYGVSMEDAATAITLLAKVNIQGTAAGTSLRNMLKELYAPTDKAAKVMKYLGLSAVDSSGNLRSMADVMYDLKGKLASFDKASQINILQQLFGERGAKEAIAMLSLTRQEWDKLRSSIADSSGFMGQVAAELEMTTKGIFTQSKNLLEVGLIQAFQKTDGAAHELAVSLRDLFASAIFKNSIAGLVEAMSGLAVVLVKIAPLALYAAEAWAAWKVLGVISASVTAVSGALATLGGVITAARAGMAIFGTGTVVVGTALGALAAPATIVAAVLTTIYLGYKKWNDLTPESVKSAKTLTDALDRQTEKLKEQNRELEKQLHLKKTGEDMDVSLAKKQIKVLEKELADSAKKLETAGPVETLVLYEQQKRIRDQLAELRTSAAAAETESRNHDINELRVYVKDKLELIRQFERDAAKAKHEGKLKDVPDTKGLRGSLTALEFVGNTMDKSDRKRDIEKGISDLQMSLLGTGNQKFAASVSKELKAAENEYAKFSEKVSGYLTKLQAEAEKGGKLTEGQRLLAEATGKYAGQIDKVTEAALKEIDTLEEEVRVSKLLAESDSRRYEALEELDKRNLTVTDETAKIQEQTAVLMGNTAATLGNTEAKIDAEIASQQRLLRILTENDIESENTRKLRENISALEDQKVALNQLAAAGSIAKQREQWKKFSDDIERSLTDALMRGFENGESFGDNFVKSLRNMLKTAALKVVVQAIVDPVMGGVNAAFGQQGAAGMANGGSGRLGTANNLWTAYRSGEMMNTLGEFGAGASAYYGGASQVPGMSLGVDSGMLGNVSNAPGAAGWGATAAQYAPIAGGMAAGYNTAGRIGGVKGMAAGAAVGVGTAAAMGAAGSMMAGGTAAAGVSSAMGTLSAMGPVGWIAAAALLAYSAFSKKGGGPQIGEYGGVDEKGYKSSFTASGGDPLNNKGFAEVTYGQAQSLYAMVGLDAGKITLEQGYGLDPQGDSPGKAYRNLRLNGKTLTGDTFDGNNGAQWYGGNADTQGAATYLSKLTNSEIEALVKAIDNTKLTEIMAKLKANFSDLTEGMAKYQAAQALQKGLLGAILSDEEKQKRHLAEVTEYLNKAFADINMAVPTTTEGFRKLIDGVDLTTVAGQTLLQQLGAMGDAFLFVAARAQQAQAQQEEYANRLAVLQGTTTEQKIAREKELAGALTDGNKAILQQIFALEDYKAAASAAASAAADVLAEQNGWQIKLDLAQGKYSQQQLDRSLALTGASSEATKAIMQQVWALEEMQAVAMEGVDNAFGELVSAYESEISAKESLIDKTKDYIRQLKDFSQSLALGELSTLDPLGKYQAAKSAFDAVSQRAMNGDSAAIEQLQGVSEAYLQASREYYASNVQYADDYNKVQSAINKTVSVAEQQVDSMDAQLITMRRQLSSLTQINESTKSVESAITRLQTALLEAVRAGNIGDVGEQAKTASGLIKGGASELYNPLTDTWSNKGQSATTSQIREWGAKILNEQGPMALYEATKSVGLSMSSVNVIAGWKAGTAEDWAKANNLPTFANGGFVKPGWAMVGERGPELVNFATQARVYTADQTSRMVSGSGDNEVYLQQVIAELQALIRQNGAASQAMIAELQQVKAELEDLRSRTRLRDGTNG